jgi:energy-coupling factor transporter ATP-binding protein EcfA2
MKKYITTKVFTPSSLAQYSFVERESMINSQLVDSLRTPGKQIVLYGYSGCGKSTLLSNKLNQVYENEIVTRCMKGMTLENILADGFDQLGKFLKTEETQSNFSINPKLSFEYSDIKASFSVIDYSLDKTK